MAFKNGAVLDCAGYYVRGASHKHSAHVRAARRSAGVHCTPHRWKPRIKRIHGQVIVATTINSSDYYHWLVDVMPRILQARRLGYDQAKIYVEATRPFQRQSLAQAGIPDALIVDAARNLVIEADELVVPCHSMFPGAALPEWLIELVQSTFKVAMSAPRTPRRIYVSRADAATRRVANEAEAEGLLHGYGFETVRLVDWLFTDQIELFSSAEAVVGPHGGGLTNLMFCRPGTKVLELFPAFNKSDVYWLLAAALQLQYSYLKNPEEQVGGRGDADFRVNLDHLRLALENMHLGPARDSTKPDATGSTDRAPCI
jgi:capsular polysaccharide biosynthesis protein